MEGGIGRWEQWEKETLQEKCVIAEKNEVGKGGERNWVKSG